VSFNAPIFELNANIVYKIVIINDVKMTWMMGNNRDLLIYRIDFVIFILISILLPVAAGNIRGFLVNGAPRMIKLITSMLLILNYKFYQNCKHMTDSLST